MEEYRDVVDHSPLAVALIVGGAEVVACYVVVVSDFVVIRTVWIKRSIVLVANAALDGVFVSF